MTWRSDALLGVQTPRVSSVPAAAAVFDRGLDALDLAEMAGRLSLEWQATVVRLGMAETAAGAWAAHEVGVEVSRQNGKNGAVEVVELGWLVGEPGVRVLHTAHESEKALESLDALEALFRSDPRFEAMLWAVPRGKGREELTLRCTGACARPTSLFPTPRRKNACPGPNRCELGSTIRFRPRSKQGGRGGSIDRLVIDEAMIYSPASKQALQALLTTSQRPQIWYLGSAADADDQPHCLLWSGLRERGLAGDPRLCWLEWSAPDPPARSGDPVADAEARDAWRRAPETIAAANPSLGYLISQEYIDAEVASFVHAIDKWEIERLSVGRWPRLGDGSDPLLGDDEVWPAMTYEQSPVLVGDMALAVAMSEDRAWLSFAVAQWTAEGRIHLEVGYHEAPTPAATQRLVGLVTRLDPGCLAIRAAGQAAAMLPDLGAAGIEPETLTVTQWVQAAGGFYDDAINGMLSHSGDPRLQAAINGAYSVSPGAPPKSRSGGVISPLEAAAVARWALLTFCGSAPPPASPSKGSRDKPSAPRRSADELDVFAVAF